MDNSKNNKPADLPDDEQPKVQNVPESAADFVHHIADGYNTMACIKDLIDAISREIAAEECCLDVSIRPGNICIEYWRD